MTPELAFAVEQALGSPVLRARSIGGGDINDAFAVELENRERVFVKSNPRCPPGMFGAEAHGLEWLRNAGALRVPAVRAVCDDPPAPFLALELLESQPRKPDFEEELGRGLAQLHRAGAPTFGLDYDNYIGRLPQQNEPRLGWDEFYRDLRLRPQLRAARDRGSIDDRLVKQFDVLFSRLPDLLGPAEPPARLHGDLWGGNLHVDETGAPVLIDPAVYGGHREVDLAMMKLFGGFGPRVFAAYHESFPCSPGHEDRVALYQLYPLLVHVNLFGGGYVSSVAQALRSLL